MGILGTPAERIRVTDNRASGNWSLALAAAGGASAKGNQGTDILFNNQQVHLLAVILVSWLWILVLSVAGAKPGCTGTGLARRSRRISTGNAQDYRQRHWCRQVLLLGILPVLA